MDPLNVTASVVSTVQLSSGILNLLQNTSPEASSADILEYQVYCDILNQVSRQALSLPSELPDAVQTALRLCRERTRQLETILSGPTEKIARSKQDQSQSQKAIKNFGRSVKMLRDIVTDTTTHTLLQEQYRHFSKILAQVSTQINDLKMDFQPSGKSYDSADKQHQEDLNSIRDQWQANVQRLMSGDRAGRQGSNNPFSFQATIIHPHPEGSMEFFIHAKFDTGCEDNWIALATLERAFVDDQVMELEVRASKPAFGGQSLLPLGTIDVSWYPTHIGKSRQTKFLVHREVPFQMVLGRRWILEEGWSFFEWPTMGLSKGRFSKEEFSMIEENARKKGASKSQISAIRGARDTIARDGKRQEEKAASLAATPALSSSHTRSFVPLSTPQLYTSSQRLGQDIDASSVLTSEQPQSAPYEEAAEADKNTSRSGLQAQRHSIV